MSEKELLLAVGGTDGCPPARPADIVPCAQSEYGNLANDISNGIQNWYEAAVDATSQAIETVAGWF
ncbi:MULTISPECIES: hypothetical protein [Pseudoxanthomonas]|uniref:hypothetical protein n=1 Tax=Pseudoxanthomonas TaxID=83618 RepID=UPI000360F42D|nr:MULTISPECIES: hypothetical protein [Pseudoxanthomonas]RRN78346.1 hypothetical protein EIM50_15240 [Pseudoxanthomonas sp. SGD-10]